MTESGQRRSFPAGTLIAAVWLIGIGVVLLVQQLADLPWNTAWPLWVILVGVGIGASAVIGPAGAGDRFAGLGWPILLVASGALLLASTNGALAVDPLELVTRWWPLGAIGLGLWLLVAAALPGGGRATETLAIPLEGVTSAHVRLKFGGGELDVARGSAGQLVGGDFRGGVVVKRVGSGAIELEPDSPARWMWGRDWPSWRVGLSGEVPLELDVEGGASRTRLDLTDLQLRSLNIRTGASETRVLLPRAAGITRVRAEGGAASLVFEVPEGVAASIRSRMALGSTNVDAGRFPRNGDRYESPDYSTAQDRVEIEVEGGVGSLRVTSARG